ncbi:hypothetical protein [Lactiplantibacillus plantarum]|uniref:hypothetical protein n=1 Tax=Lactiplantibacillus plantarum TaxID=1590 RepID=UPI002182578F|nr:hypothetical protein [Lactiplantibacillus plantarum]MCS8620189.1 hypothetical protein [Lactiplantibacillus plantarum]
MIDLRRELINGHVAFTEHEVVHCILIAARNGDVGAYYRTRDRLRSDFIELLDSQGVHTARNEDGYEFEWSDVIKSERG